MKNHFLVYVLIFLFLCVNNIKAEQKWKSSSRLDFSWLRDSNIFESSSDFLYDNTARFLFEFSGRGRFNELLAVSVLYKCGLQAYSQYSVENRIVNDVTGNIETSLSRRIYFGLTFHERDKNFFHDNRGYRFRQGSPFIRWYFPNGLCGEIFYTHSFLDYIEGIDFDHKNQSFGVMLETSIHSKVTLNIQFFLSEIIYRRHALRYEKTFSNTFQWYDVGEPQKDQLQEISTALEIYKWALIRFCCAYQWSLSNSYGYSYNRPQIKLLLAKSLPWNLTLRFYWVIQLKNYTDALQPFVQIRPDTEDEENSFTIIDISKDIRKNTSLRFQASWYKNESPFRDHYYEKNLISVGITQRF